MYFNMIPFYKVDEKTLFVFSWFQSQLLPKYLGRSEIILSGDGDLLLSLEFVKNLSSGVLHEYVLRASSTFLPFPKDITHLLNFLCNLNGNPVYIEPSESEISEQEQEEINPYYSLDKTEYRSDFHRVTVSDLTFVNHENHNELWIKAHCAVLEAVLRIWLHCHIDNHKLITALSRMIDHQISLVANEEIQGADAALFWLVAGAASAATELGLWDCRKWLMLHMAENLGSSGSSGLDPNSTSSEETANEISVADSFLRGLAIPNLVVLLICRQLPGRSYTKDFRLNFGAQGELPLADTEHNIAKVVEICSVHFGPSSIAALPIPASKEDGILSGGVPCSDFACGLARASISRRLQAATLAGELFFCTEVQIEPFAEESKFRLDGVLPLDRLDNGRHTYRLSRGIEKLSRLAQGGSGNSFDSVLVKSRGLEQAVSSDNLLEKRRSKRKPPTPASASRSRVKLNGNSMLDAFFHRPENAGGGPNLCHPIFVGSTTTLPPIPTLKSNHESMTNRNGPLKQDEPANNIGQLQPSLKLRQRSPSGNLKLITSRVDDLVETKPINSLQDASRQRFHSARQQQSRIPRPASHHRSYTQLHNADQEKKEPSAVDSTKRENCESVLNIEHSSAPQLETFEFYQKSLHRLSSNVKEMQKHLCRIANSNEAVIVDRSLLDASTAFIPLDDTQKTDNLVMWRSRMQRKMRRSQSLQPLGDNEDNIDFPIVQRCNESSPKRITWNERMHHGYETDRHCPHNIYSCCPPLNCCSSMCAHYRCSISSSPLPGVKSACLFVDDVKVNSDCQVVKRKLGHKKSCKSSTSIHDRIRRYSRQSSSELDTLTDSSSPRELVDTHSVPRERPHECVVNDIQCKQSLLYDIDSPLVDGLDTKSPDAEKQLQRVEDRLPPILQTNNSCAAYNHQLEKVETKAKPTPRPASQAFLVNLKPNASDEACLLQVEEELLDTNIERLNNKKAQLLARCKKRESERRACSASTPNSTNRSASSLQNSVEIETHRSIKMDERRKKREQIFQIYLEKKTIQGNSSTPKSASRMSNLPPICNGSDEKNNSIKIRKGSRDESAQSGRRPLSIALSKNPDTPKLFVQPQLKSNRRVITNALIHCCLAGRVQESLKMTILQDLGCTDGRHFIVLLKPSRQFSGLYRFDVDGEEMLKVSGSGPKRITSGMIENFYKYDSGSKAFTEIGTTSHLSTVVDAVTLLRQSHAKIVPSRRKSNEEAIDVIA